jgi:hypothetical protein
MSTIRFALLAVGLSRSPSSACRGSTRGLRSWSPASRRSSRIRVCRRSPRVPSPLWGNERIEVSEEMQKQMRENWEISKTSQSDGDGERDKLRRELLQAANAYALSPCDKTIKGNLVEAQTNYTRAWQAMVDCKPGVGDCPAKQDGRIDRARAAFHAPADVRVTKRCKRRTIRVGLIATICQNPYRRT